MNEHKHCFKTSFHIIGKYKQGLLTHLKRVITLSNIYSWRSESDNWNCPESELESDVGTSNSKALAYNIKFCASLEHCSLRRRHIFWCTLKALSH